MVGEGQPVGFGQQHVGAGTHRLAQLLAKGRITGGGTGQLKAVGHTEKTLDCRQRQ